MSSINVLARAGWKWIDEAVHGERYLQLMLENLGAAAATARTAVAGWDGDIYRACLKGESVLIVLATTWDSESDALEFSRAYGAALRNKYPGFKAASTVTDRTVTDRTVFTCGKGLGSGLLVRRGREVFAVEGADAATAARIMAELKAAKIEHVKE